MASLGASRKVPMNTTRVSNLGLTERAPRWKALTLARKKLIGRATRIRPCSFSSFYPPQSRQIKRLRGAGPVGAKIRGKLISAGMDKLDLRVLLGNFQCRIQVAEARRNDEFGALLDHVLHDPFRIRPFRDILDLDHLHIRRFFFMICTPSEWAWL